MTNEKLIEAVARKMAIADGHGPDTRIFMAATYGATIGDCQAYFLNELGGGNREAALWECYYRQAARAVEFVAAAVTS